MAWLPSHQDLRTHPKTRKAARRLDVTLPTMIGHLHLLWYWALDLAPDGDLSKFDDEDIADGADWTGDPEQFVDALAGCGSGGAPGFIDPDRRLHDWAEYGGKYGKRVDAARKAAAARWHSESNAGAMPTHSERIAPVEQPQSNRNAEERRGEEKREQTPKRPRKRALPPDWSPNDQHRTYATEHGIDVDFACSQFRDHHTAKASTFVDWDRAFNTWLRNEGRWNGTKRKPPPQLANVHQLQANEGGRF
jgi:hypothetical protein